MKRRKCLKSWQGKLALNLVESIKRYRRRLLSKKKKVEPIKFHEMNWLTFHYHPKNKVGMIQAKHKSLSQLSLSTKSRVDKNTCKRRRQRRRCQRRQTNFSHF